MALINRTGDARFPADVRDGRGERAATARRAIDRLDPFILIQNFKK